MLTINVTCPFCDKEYQVEVPEEGYNRWVNGELIQRAMPDVAPEVREALISGICENCWADMFGGDE
jgi:hypothetical protein